MQHATVTQLVPLSSFQVSFTYVDNYCHGLILGYDALYPNSPALGKFYVVTDGDYQV